MKLGDAEVRTLNAEEKKGNSASARIQGATIVDVCNWPLTEVARFFEALKLDARQKKIAGEVLHEIRNRLQFLVDVGLEYLTLHRSAPTLSGGEAQRIKLARELSKKNTGRSMYILDEPTTGLHFADVHKLIEVLNKLVAAGSTVLVIEHNLDVIKSCDWLIDLGPEGGEQGGEIIAQGPPEVIAKSKQSETGRFLKPMLAKKSRK